MKSLLRCVGISIFYGVIFISEITMIYGVRELTQHLDDACRFAVIVAMASCACAQVIVIVEYFIERIIE